MRRALKPARGTRVGRSGSRTSASHWEQSFPFSCGPAALGAVLTELGWRSPGNRLEEEIAIWRESTAVACPGAHPLGLALAAVRRGFSASVVIEGMRPWLREHVVSGHRLLTASDYTRFERLLRSECRRARVPVRGGPPDPSRPVAGLLLVTALPDPGTEPDPHWIGLVPRARSGYIVHDPLRSRAYRSARPWAEWWDRSGFQGTRSWVTVSTPALRIVPA